MSDGAAGPAVELYERFCATPLRLKTPTREKSAEDLPEPGSNDSTSALQPSERMTPLPRREVAVLEQWMGSACRVTPRHQAAAREAAAAERRELDAAGRTEDDRSPLDLDSIVVASSRKHKRASRSVAMLDFGTGYAFVDTPTKSQQPPKRTRRGSRGCVEEEMADAGSVEEAARKTDAESNVMNVARNMMNAFDDCDDDDDDDDCIEEPQDQPDEELPPCEDPDPVVMQDDFDETWTTSRLRSRSRASSFSIPVRHPRRSTRSARPLPTPKKPKFRIAQSTAKKMPTKQRAQVDGIARFCEPLLRTKTASGSIFALWFQALFHDVEQFHDLVEDDSGDCRALTLMFDICIGISQCEALTKEQAPAASATTTAVARLGCTPRKNRNGRVLSRTTATTPKKKTKKLVRFRQFDLSSLSLAYVEDAAIADLIERLLQQYVRVMECVAVLRDQQRYPAQATTFQQVIQTLRDAKRLFAPSALLEQAYAYAMPTELQACRRFYSREFDKLLPPQDDNDEADADDDAFLQSVFSHLLSSLARFWLRFLFLPFDPDALVNGPRKLALPEYEHQDYGAAIHRALKELLLFRPLVDALVTASSNPNKNAIADAVAAMDDDDQAHARQAIRACRYLYLSLTMCLRPDDDLDDDPETIELVAKLERLCALAEMLQFQDEAHLFPLANIDRFLVELKACERQWRQVEDVLEAAHQEYVCTKCHASIPAAETTIAAIQCSLCSGWYHLGCLHLPPSFLQFATNYTCPNCFLMQRR